MGRAIGLTVLGMLLFFGYTWVIFYIGVKGHELAVRRDELAGIKGSRLIKKAAQILSHLGVASTLDDVEIISPTNQEAIKEWLDTYNKYVERVK